MANITQVSQEEALQRPIYLTHHTKNKNEWLSEKINREGKGRQIIESREFITYTWAENYSLSASLPTFFAAQ